MIHVEKLAYRYGKGKEVFRNFSIDFLPGRVYGLLGRNGEGKSTLLHLICGLLKPQKGVVSLYGYNSYQRQPEMLEKVFLIPEEFYLPDISLKEYVRINTPFYKRFSQTDLENNLAAFGLDASVHLGALSMGEKKKVYMCFALATNTPYLIMDEPSNGLDIPSKEQFRRVIAQSMNADRTIIISTHQVRDVDTLLNHIIMIEQGQVLLDRSVKELTDAIAFYEGTADSVPADALLYSQPSVNGVSMIVRKTVDAEATPVNIEVLFNAMILSAERMKAVLGSTAK